MTNKVDWVGKKSIKNVILFPSLSSREREGKEKKKTKKTVF